MSTKQLNDELNQMILRGEAMEAFERFYADDVVMIENDLRFEGKAENRRREADFMRAVETHAIQIRASAAGGDVSFCEQVLLVTLEDGRRVRLEEVAVRRWRDGRVVEERFYYKPVSGGPAAGSKRTGT